MPARSSHELTARACRVDLPRSSAAVGPWSRGLREIVEDAGRADDRRVLRMRERNLDHFDAEERRVRILLRRERWSSPTARCGDTRRRRTRDVDVDVVAVLRIDEHRVRVRSAARLHVRDVLWIRDVGDVEDANAANALLAHRRRHALCRRSPTAPSVPRPRRTADSCRPTRRSATPGSSKPVLSVGRPDC